MPYNVSLPRRTPHARVGSALVGRGASMLKWKCQRRGCTTLIPPEDIGCPEHERGLPDDLRRLAEITKHMSPVTLARRRVLVAADKVWEAKRRVR